MYGLPQAGIIAQELLEERLLKAGYSQSKITPGYWKNEWRPISFTLVVDNLASNILAKSMSSISYKYLNKTMKPKKIGKEPDTLVRPLTGTTRNEKSIYLCRATLRKPLHVLVICSPSILNINHTNTQFPPTEQPYSMPRQRTQQTYFPKTRKHIFNK
jgi:hypothetical protein